MTSVDPGVMMYLNSATFYLGGLDCVRSLFFNESHLEYSICNCVQHFIEINNVITTYLVTFTARKVQSYMN